MIFLVKSELEKGFKRANRIVHKQRKIFIRECILNDTIWKLHEVEEDSDIEEEIEHEEELQIIKIIRKPDKPKWMTLKSYQNSTLNTELSLKRKACPGCNQEFALHRNGTIKTSPELAYCVHCVEDCDEYRQLDLIRQCHTCKCVFLNKSSLNRHQGGSFQCKINRTAKSIP